MNSPSTIPTTEHCSRLDVGTEAADRKPVDILRALKNTRDALNYAMAFVPINDPLAGKVSVTLAAADRTISLAEHERDALAHRLIAEVVQENAAGQS